MATQSSSVLVYDVTTDARFRAICQFVEDTLVTIGGWKVTPDTGQTLPSALVHPTVANTKMGYRIYRMNDALQSTAPVFLRIDFGSANILTCPAFWLTIGTGSNGSGTITGIIFNGGASAQATVNGPTSTSSSPNQAGLSYGSASNNRFSICLVSNPVTPSATIIFTLERSKNAIGEDTNDGLLMIWKSGQASSANGNMDQSLYLKFSGTQPALEGGLHYILSSKNPGQMFFPGDVGVGIVIHIASIAQQPGTNMLVTNSGDVTIDSQIQLTLYSHIRTYVHCGIICAQRALTTGGGGSPLDNISRILMRYD